MPNRAFRVIWGDDVEPALRPLLAVGFAGSLAASTAWTFVGIWAVDELGASSAQLGVYFVLAAVISAGGGYFGGHISDHVGRRPVILAGWAATTVMWPTYTLADDFSLAMPLLLVVSATASIAIAADQALIADVVGPARHQHR